MLNGSEREIREIIHHLYCAVGGWEVGYVGVSRLKEGCINRFRIQSFNSHFHFAL